MWVSDARTAADVADRMLPDASRPRYRVPVARQQRRLVPGDVVTASVPALGLSGSARSWRQPSTSADRCRRSRLAAGSAPSTSQLLPALRPMSRRPTRASTWRRSMAIAWSPSPTPAGGRLLAPPVASMARSPRTSDSAGRVAFPGGSDAGRIVCHRHHGAGIPAVPPRGARMRQRVIAQPIQGPAVAPVGIGVQLLRVGRRQRNAPSFPAAATLLRSRALHSANRRLLRLGVRVGRVGARRPSASWALTWDEMGDSPCFEFDPALRIGHGADRPDQRDQRPTSSCTPPHDKPRSIGSDLMRILTRVPPTQTAPAERQRRAAALCAKIRAAIAAAQQLVRPANDHRAQHHHLRRADFHAVARTTPARNAARAFAPAMRWRTSSPSLSHNGDANARVIYDGTDSLDITTGASVSGGWLVGANRVEWVYDIEDHDLRTPMTSDRLPRERPSSTATARARRT